MVDTKVKIVILGLRDRFRGKDLYEVLKKQNFDVEVFWGYTKTETEELSKFSHPRKNEFLYGRTLTWSEIACAVGHRKILEKAMSENVDLLIVFEDDVMINDTNWLNEKISQAARFLEPTLTLLLVDSRLCLTGKSFLRMSHQKTNSRIYSNPSPSAAYIYNKQALERIGKMPADIWHGTQADFPPGLIKEILPVDGSMRVKPFPIALVEVESNMSDRLDNYRSTIKFRLWYLHKILFLGYRESRNYGLDFKSYFYHFIARPLAWKLNRGNIPIQKINPQN